MTAFSESTFSQILMQAKRRPSAISSEESSLLYRTLFETYNPRAFLWSVLGACCSLTSVRLVHRRWMTSRRYFFSGVVGALYGNELSWSLRDQYPVYTFFSDVKHLRGELSMLIPPLSSRRVDTRGPGIRFIDFLALDRTLDGLWNFFSVEYKNQEGSRIWPQLLVKEIDEYSDLYCRLYWKVRFAV